MRNHERMRTGGHRLILLLVCWLLAPAAAGAQWASVGDASRPERRGDTLVFRTPQGVLSVAPLAPEVVRVRFAPGSRFGRDHSYAVLPQKPAGAARFEVGPRESRVITPALRVTIRHRPLTKTIRHTASRRRGARFASGSGCATTNRSTASEKRTDGSTSAAGSSAATAT
jgi:hypothetical protein